MPRWPTSTECPGERAMETSSRRGSQLFKMMTGYTFKIRKYKNVVDNNNLVYHMFIHCCVIWTPAPRAYPPAGRSLAARRRTGRATASAAATAGTICHRGTRLGTGEENICCRFSKIFHTYSFEKPPGYSLGERSQGFWLYIDWELQNGADLTSWI